ncbi:MAG: tRNA pseudouridine(13) synthase TruD [Candidatus Anstonellales archaeon]
MPSPSTFFVHEISETGRIAGIDNFSGGAGPYTRFVLKKSLWATPDAIRVISKALRVGASRFGYAGNKDRNATTFQLVSAYKIPASSLSALSIKDISLSDFHLSESPVRIGALLGNRFKATLPIPDEIVVGRASLVAEIPNFFGEQRFGNVRRNTAKVGYLILKGLFRDAVMEILTSIKGEKHKEAIEARKRLSEELNFSSALEYFPRHLKLERLILSSLAEHERDFINAFRRLPIHVRTLFVHAFQSYLFNLELKERIEEGPLEQEQGEYFCASNSYGFPDIGSKGDQWFVGKLIGYESVLSKRQEELLSSFGLKKEDFKVRQMPELSAKGSFRALFVPVLDFKMPIEFSLPKGAYATVFLNFLERKEFLPSEFFERDLHEL